MNEIKAIETIEKGKRTNIPTHRLEYCHGYLEAIEKSNKLQKALDDVDNDLIMAEHDVAWIDHARDIIKETLENWRNEK